MHFSVTALNAPTSFPPIPSLLMREHSERLRNAIYSTSRTTGHPVVDSQRWANRPTGVKTSNNHSRWTRRRQEMLQPESGPKARTRRRQEMLQPEIEARSVGLTAQQVTAYSESVQV